MDLSKVDISIKRLRVGQGLVVADGLEVMLLDIKSAEIRLVFSAEKLPEIHDKARYFLIQNILREEDEKKAAIAGRALKIEKGSQK